MRLDFAVPHGINQAELQSISQIGSVVVCGGLLLLLAGCCLLVFALVFGCVGGLDGGEG
jgi:hypothetical protein